MDYIPGGSIDQSIPFAVSQSGLDVTEFRYSWTRWKQGDGTSWATASAAITAALASLNSAHADGKAKYVSAVATDGNKFEIRVDVADAVCAIGADFVLVALYDDNDEEIAHRVFKLTNREGDAYGGKIYHDSNSSNTNSIKDIDGVPTNPINDIDALEILKTKTGLREVELIGTFDQSGSSGLIDLTRMTFNGSGNGATIVGESSIDLSYSKFKNCLFPAGSLDNPDTSELTFEDCIINSALGDINKLILKSCFFSLNAALIPAVLCRVENGKTTDTNLELNGQDSGNFELIAYKGNLQIKNITGGSQAAYIHLQGGNIIIDPSCTDGLIILEGWGNVTDNSAGTAVITTNFQSMPVDVQAGVDAALDDANTASAIPNTETGSIRDWIQMAATLLKHKKTETDVLQTVFKEDGASVYGTRTIVPGPATTELGELN